MYTPASILLLVIESVIWTAVVFSCAATVLGFGGHWLWQFELASHFRVQYLFVLLLGALFLLGFQRYWGAVLAVCFALVNLYFLVLLYIPPDTAVKNVRNLRVVSINVKAENQKRKELFNLIHDSNPDFLVLFEVDKSWSAASRELAQRFKYSRISETSGYFSSAIFSRYPIRNVELKMFGRVSHYAMVVSLTVEGQPFYIIAAHTLAPTKNAYFQMRNSHLDSLASTARLLQGHVMLIGDLNLSTWSPYFNELIMTAGLTDSRRGFGVQATWPVRYPLLRIPIDHCLTSPSININNWARGPDIGSDHFPVIIDFSIDGSAHQK